MSTQSAHSDRSTSAHRARITQQLETLTKPFQFVGFWTAVLLPFVTFPMLATGAASEHLTPFAALVLANVVALVVGRNYNAE